MQNAMRDSHAQLTADIVNMRFLEPGVEVDVLTFGDGAGPAQACVVRRRSPRKEKPIIYLTSIKGDLRASLVFLLGQTERLVYEALGGDHVEAILDEEWPC